MSLNAIKEGISQFSLSIPFSEINLDLDIEKPCTELAKLGKKFYSRYGRKRTVRIFILVAIALIVSGLNRSSIVDITVIYLRTNGNDTVTICIVCSR